MLNHTLQWHSLINTFIGPVFTMEGLHPTQLTPLLLMRLEVNMNSYSTYHLCKHNILSLTTLMHMCYVIVTCMCYVINDTCTVSCSPNFVRKLIVNELKTLMEGHIKLT